MSKRTKLKRESLRGADRAGRFLGLDVPTFGDRRRNAVSPLSACHTPPAAADASGNSPLMRVGTEVSRSLYQFLLLSNTPVQGLIQEQSLAFGSTTQVDEQEPQIPTTSASLSLRWHSRLPGPVNVLCAIYSLPAMPNAYQLFTTIRPSGNWRELELVPGGQCYEAWRLENTYNVRDPQQT